MSQSNAQVFCLKQVTFSPSHHARFFKTKLCKFQAVGVCRKGQHCSFAHSILVAIRFFLRIVVEKLEVPEVFL